MTEQPRRGPKPLLAEEGKGNGEITLLWFFIVGPMVALAAAVPVFGAGPRLARHGLRRDVLRYRRTRRHGELPPLPHHGAYKAKRWLEITMAVAACLSSRCRPSAG